MTPSIVGAREDGKLLIDLPWRPDSSFVDVIGAVLLYIEGALQTPLSETLWDLPSFFVLRSVASYGLHAPRSRDTLSTRKVCPEVAVILWPRSEKRLPALIWLGGFTNW